MIDQDLIMPWYSIAVAVFRLDKELVHLMRASGKDFTARDLTILRAYEWDRINFTGAEKRKRTADLMGISEEELLKIRRETLMKAASLSES